MGSACSTISSSHVHQQPLGSALPPTVSAVPGSSVVSSSPAATAGPGSLAAAASDFFDVPMNERPATSSAGPHSTGSVALSVPISPAALPSQSRSLQFNLQVQQNNSGAVSASVSPVSPNDAVIRRRESVDREESRSRKGGSLNAGSGTGSGSGSSLALPHLASAAAAAPAPAATRLTPTPPTGSNRSPSPSFKKHKAVPSLNLNLGQPSNASPQISSAAPAVPALRFPPLNGVTDRRPSVSTGSPERAPIRPPFNLKPFQIESVEDMDNGEITACEEAFYQAEHEPEGIRSPRHGLKLALALESDETGDFIKTDQEMADDGGDSDGSEASDISMGSDDEESDGSMDTSSEQPAPSRPLGLKIPQLVLRSVTETDEIDIQSFRGQRGLTKLQLSGISQNETISTGPAAGGSDLPESYTYNKTAKLQFFLRDCTCITDFLFLGGMQVAQNRELLKSKGITHILNCCGDVCENVFESTGDFKYMRLFLLDSPSEDISCVLYPIVDFIETAVNAGTGQKVYIHCAQGVSRSTILCIGYLMLRLDKDYDEVHAIVRKARNITRPNVGFMCQLLNWRKRVRGCSTRLAMLYRFAPHCNRDPTRLVNKWVDRVEHNELDSRFIYVLHTAQALFIYCGELVSNKRWNKCLLVLKNIIKKLQRYEHAPFLIYLIKKRQINSLQGDAQAAAAAAGNVVQSCPISVSVPVSPGGGSSTQSIGSQWIETCENVTEEYSSTADERMDIEKRRAEQFRASNAAARRSSNTLLNSFTNRVGRHARHSSKEGATGNALLGTESFYGGTMSQIGEDAPDSAQPAQDDDEDIQRLPDFDPTCPLDFFYGALGGRPVFGHINHSYDEEIQLEEDAEMLIQPPKATGGSPKQSSPGLKPIVPDINPSEPSPSSRRSVSRRRTSFESPSLALHPNFHPPSLISPSHSAFLSSATSSPKGQPQLPPLKTSPRHMNVAQSDPHSVSQSQGNPHTPSHSSLNLSSPPSNSSPTLFSPSPPSVPNPNPAPAVPNLTINLNLALAPSSSSSASTSAPAPSAGSSAPLIPKLALAALNSPSN